MSDTKDFDALRKHLEKNDVNSRITVMQTLHSLTYEILKDFIIAYDDGEPEMMLDVYLQAGEIIKIWDEAIEQYRVYQEALKSGGE